MSAPIIVAEIDNYISEKKDFIVPLLKAGKHSLIISNTGCGKALRNGTGVLTDSGFVSIENLKIGDKVYGEDGETYPLLGVFPQGRKEIWTVVLADGARIDTCEDHLWSIVINNIIKTFSTKELNNMLNSGERIFIPTAIGVSQDFRKFTSLLKNPMVEETKKKNEIVVHSEDLAKEIKLEGEKLGFVIYWKGIGCENFLTIRREPTRQIVRIFRTGEYDQMTCISTSNPSELFLTENCVVTHNTTFCLNLAKESNYSVLLSPTRVIVDQFIATAKKEGLEVIRHEELGDWAYGEFLTENSGKIWIGTFAALRKANIDWNSCDYIFIDEIHFLLDLSLFGKETALDVWNLTQVIAKYPKAKLVSLTASDELVLPLQKIFKFDKIFLAKSDRWRLRPNRLIIYPTIRGLSNISYILHYARNYVKEGEKILCVVKSYKELQQLRDVKKYLPPDVEIANAQDKKDSETYWEICFNSAYPKRIKVFITTTWISLGASIHDPEVKHVICTFPNYSIVYQSLSRIRSGAVNVAVMQLPSLHSAPVEDISLDGMVEDIIKNSEQEDNKFNIEYYTPFNGKWLFFPLAKISDTYQKQQEYLFSNLDLLEQTLSDNLDCEVQVLWKELLPYRQTQITGKEFIKIQQQALGLKFPITGRKGLIESLQLKVVN